MPIVAKCDSCGERKECDIIIAQPFNVIVCKKCQENATPIEVPDEAVR